MFIRPEERFMQLAIEQAEIAEGNCSPNPPVGAVIVRDGYVVAKGFTAPPGQNHAEINALENWDGERPQDCTFYVTLEPCCVHGRTPPCVDAIIASGIKRFVIGTIDPSPPMRGRGIELLEQAGCSIRLGVLEDECKHLIWPFRKRLEKGLPFVGVKWAMTVDGKIATKTGDSQWISSIESRNYVHKLRNMYDGIMIGTRTLLVDDPRLTTRLENGRDATRIVLDTNLEGPLSATVYNLDSNAQTWVFTAHDTFEEKKNIVSALTERGVKVVPVTRLSERKIDVIDVMKFVSEQGLNTVLVEGGGETIASMLESKLVDRIYSFIAPRIIGNQDALSPVRGEGVDLVADSFKLKPIGVEKFGTDILIINDVV